MGAEHTPAAAGACLASKESVDRELDTKLHAHRRRWLGVDPGDYDELTSELEPYLALIDAPLLAACRGRVLELCCGTGRLLDQLATQPEVHEAIGIDIAPRMVAVAADRGHRVVQASAMALPFTDRCFDSIVCAFYTMRDLDRPAVYAEAARVLRPGGVLAFTLRSYYPVYVETLWRHFLRRGHLPQSWRTLDRDDGIDDNLRSVTDELGELERAGFQARDVQGLQLLPFLRRFVRPGYWKGPRTAALGSDVIFIARRPS
jgi:SAM-dependent methyltransferase